MADNDQARRNVDIFRLEDDRIVEHWDVVQDLVRPEATASGNSMV
ncbi:hypothetical protein ABZV81_25700 [Streptomyces parvus]